MKLNTNYRQHFWAKEIHLSLLCYKEVNEKWLMIFWFKLDKTGSKKDKALQGFYWQKRNCLEIVLLVWIYLWKSYVSLADYCGLPCRSKFCHQQWLYFLVLECFYMALVIGKYESSVWVLLNCSFKKLNFVIWTFNILLILIGVNY